MTFEEAKKILKSEGFEPERFLGVLVEDVKAASWEKIEVSEAMKVVAENGYFPFMEKSKYEERKARLKKEYEKNTKAPGPGEEQSKEGELKAATKMFGAQAREIMRLTAENAELRETIDKMKEGNPALKEALNESASQFNDALLNEQGKKIAELTMENERLKDQVAVLDVYKKHNDKINRKQIKGLGKEISKLNGIIHKKNLKIEEFGKESSRHLEGKMKMFGENFDLEQELKDKDAVLSDVAEELRLSKIREKNLTEVCQKYVKEVEDLREQLANKVVDKIDAQALKSAESALAWKEKKIAEKDEVIAELREKLKSINMNRHNERICKKQLAEKDEVIADLGKELAEAKKLNTAKILDINAKCMRAARESINDVFESYAAKYAKSTLDELKDKAYELFNAKAHNLGPVGSKDGNGIFDQMVGADKAEEGADLSGVIVLCGKDFIDAIKKMK